MHLKVTDHFYFSLFDSAEQRYLKARLNVQAIALAQFGLTAYVSVGANRYDAYMYNFYLFPEAIGGIDTRFTMQASSVQFLTQYKFDFNKMMYEDYLRANSGFSSNLTDAHQALLRKYCSKIARWLIHAKEDDVFTLEKHLDDGEVELSNEVLHRILINRIDNIWPQPSADNVLIVEKVSPSRRAELMEHWSVGETDYEKSLESYRGFTNVIDHVIKKRR
ncbi:PNLDC1 [Bugula neritina]|uniref:PNLDC1 n=1 Tax=Bugula neritina TaxID=10212 RepID=A0A7J7J3N0_BUGNE|nr:PNLDC1 [Bugula neritina]